MATTIYDDRATWEAARPSDGEVDLTQGGTYAEDDYIPAEEEIEGPYGKIFTTPKQMLLLKVGGSGWARWDCVEGHEPYIYFTENGDPYDRYNTLTLTFPSLSSFGCDICINSWAWQDLTMTLSDASSDTRSLHGNCQEAGDSGAQFFGFISDQNITTVEFDLEYTGSYPGFCIGLITYSLLNKGLRIGTEKIGVEYLASTHHKYRIQRGGSTYGVPLIPTTDDKASKVRVYDGSATKALPQIDS